MSRIDKNVMIYFDTQIANALFYRTQILQTKVRVFFKQISFNSCETQTPSFLSFINFNNLSLRTK